MGKKMKLPFLSKNTHTLAKSSSSWPWPSCHQTRTLSFRNYNDNNSTNGAMFKTINLAYLDAETTESSLFTNTSSESATASFSTASEECSNGDPVETVIRGLRSERLFFEPGETSSILEEAKTSGFPYKESLVCSMESQDPYVDFKKSMVEMVEAHGLKDWEDLEELLCCYLRMNGKSNHGYIVGAFVDLLVALAFANSTSTSSDFITCSSSSLASRSCSPSSPLSFYTSSSSDDDDSSSIPCCLSSLFEAEDDDEIKKQQKDDDASSS